MYRLGNLLALSAACLFSGCAHHNLAYDHISQARTLTNIHEQQVLDNLAMFSSDPNAIPFYAIPSVGSAKVTDNTSIGVSTLNGPLHSVLGPLGLSRNNALTWATIPVTDAAKLAQMQAAYRRALGYFDFIDECESEIVRISECESSLARRPCEKVGKYCGKSIRVCPVSNDAFSRLVLEIMHHAENAPRGDKTMTVNRIVYNGDGTGDGNSIAAIETFTAKYIDRTIIGSASTKNSASITEGVRSVDGVKYFPEWEAVDSPRYQSDLQGGVRGLQNLQTIQDIVNP